MEPTVKRTESDLVQLFDEQGRLIGAIVHAIVEPVTGPGAEKVYLARRPASRDRTPQAA